MFARPKPIIRFLCAPEDEGVIAPPVLSKTHLPDWFRKLPAVDPAKMTGYLIPLAATVRLDISNDGQMVTAGWDFDKTMVSNHGSHQMAGNPRSALPPCKFHNYWSIRTPKGWSCLFVPLLNRTNPLFEPVAGIVDTDSYVAPIHFPFFAHGPVGLHEIEKGTPLVQVIPFERASTQIEAEIGAESVVEAAERRSVFRNTLASPGWYRRFARAAR